MEVKTDYPSKCRMSHLFTRQKVVVEFNSA